MAAVASFIKREGLLLEIGPHHLHIQPALSNHQLQVVTGLPACLQAGDHLIHRQGVREINSVGIKHGIRLAWHVKAQSLQSVMGPSTSIMIAIQ